MLAAQTAQTTRTNSTNTANTAATAANSPATANTVNSNIAANSARPVNAANQNSTVALQGTPTPAPGDKVKTAETDGWYIVLLVAIMIATGLFGGLVNYLLNGRVTQVNGTTPPPAKWWQGWLECLNYMLIGVAATLLVPFFLQTSSSQLLADGYNNYLSLLTFAGFCLIAAISARAFITTLSNKILQAAQDAQNTAQEASEKAAEASSKADDAKGTAESARKVASLSANAPAVPTPADPTTNAGGTGAGGGTVTGGESGTGAGTVDTPDSLIAEYTTARSQMNASWTRTDKMAAIFSKMIGTAAVMDDFPVEEYIGDTNNEGGKRLFGYAYFFNRPDLALLPQLVNSVINIEKTSFAQYWGIQAIGKVIAERGTTPVDPAIVAQLKAFYETLDPSTDRSIELKNVLAQLGGIK